MMADAFESRMPYEPQLFDSFLVGDEDWHEPRSDGNPPTWCDVYFYMSYEVCGCYNKTSSQQT